MRTFVDPWGLWQGGHVILPSRTGMCELRSCFCTCGLWHVPHSSIWFAFTSCPRSDFAEWTEWQETHPRLRAAWALLSHIACSVLLWQVRHVALTSRAGILLNFRMCPFASSSTCAWPGPWHDSQPCSAAGVPGILALPCAVPCNVAV